MTAVVSEINLIKSNGLNHHQFQQPLAGNESVYDNVKYFSYVRWLSKSDMLRCAYKLLNEIKLFLEMKHGIVEFDDEEWKCEFAFLVDIMQHMDDLN
jgi:hypothetical protein